MNATAINPAEFVAAVQSGELAARNRAFRSLYDNRMIIAKIADWAKFYNLRKVEPDDILQEGILKLDELIREKVFRGASRVETFLLGICKNLIRDSTRTKGRLVLKGEITDADCPDPDAVADRMRFEEANELENRRDKLLLTLIESMKNSCPDDLKMFYYQQKTAKQIEETRNIGEGMAKKALYRCRQQLRELIEKHPALMGILNQLA